VQDVYGTIVVETAIDDVDLCMVDSHVHRVYHGPVIGVNQELTLGYQRRPPPDVVVAAVSTIDYQSLSRLEHLAGIARRSEGHADRIVISATESRYPGLTAHTAKPGAIDNPAVVLGKEDMAGVRLDGHRRHIAPTGEPHQEAIGIDPIQAVRIGAATADI